MFKTIILQSHLCGYSNTYIVVEGTITVTDPNNDPPDKTVFKNNRNLSNYFWSYYIHKLNTGVVGNINYIRDLKLFDYNTVY